MYSDLKLDDSARPCLSVLSVPSLNLEIRSSACICENHVDLEYATKMCLGSPLETPDARKPTREPTCARSRMTGQA